MATPPFQSSQTSTHVHLQIQSQECSTSQCTPRAVVDSGNVFGIACQHFHLPFLFPEDALVDGTASSRDSQQGSSVVVQKTGGTIDVRLQKKKPGEELSNLQSLKPCVFPLLEDDDEGRNEERLFGLAMLQKGMEAMKGKGIVVEEDASAGMRVPSAPCPPRLSKSAKTKVHECFSEEFLDADEMASRKVAAYEQEERHWDEGMYLDSFVDEDGEIQHLIQATVDTPSDIDCFKQSASTSTALHRDMHLLLLELLLAQAYDHRTTLGDPTVESAWTICVLCRSLVSSCLPSFDLSDTVSSILIGSMRRQLSFPLYRSWDLSINVCRDVITPLRRPRCQSLLSSIRRLLDNETEDEAMQVYSANVLVPLIVNFDRYFSAASLSMLADEVEAAIEKVTRNQVGGNWDMDELEAAAQEALEQGEGGYV